MHEMTFWRVIFRDVWLVVVLMIIGMVLVVLSTPLATAVGEPAFAPLGLFTGGVFFIAALSHIIRRLFFHPLYLYSFAMKAFETPTGAGLVVLGMCLVLASFVLVMGGMLRL
jgi:hypothetical protein